MLNDYSLPENLTLSDDSGVVGVSEQHALSTVVLVISGQWNADITVLTPGWAPRVSDDSVVHILISVIAVADGDHTVVDTLRALTSVNTGEVVVELVSDTVGNSERVLSEIGLEALNAVRASVLVTSGVEMSIWDLILVASGLIVSVRIVSKVNSTILAPESKGISWPATLATSVHSGVARDQVLLRKLVEGSKVDSVDSLGSTSGHESPAGTTRLLITDRVHEAPISPVDVIGRFIERTDESVLRPGINATNWVVNGTVVSAVSTWLNAALVVIVANDSAFSALIAHAGVVVTSIAVLTAWVAHVELIITVLGISALSPLLTRLSIIVGTFRADTFCTLSKSAIMDASLALSSLVLTFRASVVARLAGLRFRAPVFTIKASWDDNTVASIVVLTIRAAAVSEIIGDKGH